MMDDAQGVTLLVDVGEFLIINNSLNEVAHGIRISDSTDWLGRPRSDASRLLDSLRDEVGVDSLEPDSTDLVRLRLTLVDLKLVRAALVKTTNGEHISERGYHPRIGAWLEEGKQLLTEVEALIKALSRGSYFT